MSLSRRLAHDSEAALGAFKVTGQIGVGGMEEIYRATDTKLGRDVAIKTQPASLAGDARPDQSVHRCQLDVTRCHVLPLAVPIRRSLAWTIG